MLRVVVVVDMRIIVAVVVVSFNLEEAVVDDLQQVLIDVIGLLGLFVWRSLFFKAV